MAKSNQNTETKEQVVLKTTIERIHLLRNVRDISTWRAALQSAESQERPERVRLYEVYKEISDDPHLAAVCQKVKFRCTNSRIWWQVNGERADKEHPMNLLTGSSYFQDIVDFIVESRLYGHSLIQLNFLLSTFNPEIDEGVELVHRPNVRPEYGDILPRQGDEKNAIPYRKPPYSNFLLEVGRRRDLGLLNKAAPNILYKRYGVIDWQEFLEVYGMPIREIQYDPNNPANRTEAQKALEGQGSNAGVILPIGSTFKLHDSAKAGNSDAFEQNAHYHNGEISKLILLGTMTTEDGSSRSQSDTHQKGEDEAIWAYQLFVEMTLNEKLKPILARHGWQAEEDGEFGYGDTERLNKSALADILVKLQSIADIPQSYIYERFNIPAPIKGDVIKDNPAVKSQQPDLAPGGKKPDPEKKKLSDDGPSFDLSTPDKSTLDNCCNPSSAQTPLEGGRGVTLAYDNTPITQQEKDLLKNIWDGVQKTGKIPRQHFKELSSLLISGIDEGYPEPAADWNSPDHLRRSLLEANVQRFSAAKDLAMVQRLNELKNGAKDFEDFRQQAQPLLGDFNANWLRAEYNHAVASSQNAAAYLRQLDDADIFPFWRYQTVGDARVRIAHERLDGLVFDINDPESARVYPPNGFNCRCEAIPLSDRDGEEVSSLENAIDRMGGEAWDLMTKKGFDQNPGDTLRIFPRNMEYLRGFEPNGLDWQSFLLASYRDMKALPRFKAKPLATGEARKWFESKHGNLGLDSDDAIRLKDYRNRPVQLEKALVEDLIIKAQAGQLTALEQVLEHPDEVWMEEGNAFLRRHIKFYEGRALSVTVIFSKGNPESILSISLIDDNQGNLIDALRKGILAFSKK